MAKKKPVKRCAKCGVSLALSEFDLRGRGDRQAYCKTCMSTYQKTNDIYGEPGRGSGGRSSGRVGVACELVVRADLLARGFEVTVPCNPQAKHDLHVDLPSVGWKGVQVKAGVLSRSTNALRCRRGGVDSPVLAVVFLPTRVVEYQPGSEPLPKELAP